MSLFKIRPALRYGEGGGNEYDRRPQRVHVRAHAHTHTHLLAIEKVQHTHARTGTAIKHRSRSEKFLAFHLLTQIRPEQIT